MTGKGGDRPSAPPRLSRDDLELWTYATRDVRAKPGRRRAVETVAPSRTKELHKDTRPDGGTARPARVSRPGAHLTPVGGLDRRKMRKIASGRVEIEARLDLHGLFQQEAHAALRRFLLSSSTRGMRHVLVITGRGSRTARNSEVGGVLRRNVPLWLSGPDLREVVISYATAHVRHGGEGALYVTLRTRSTT
jgi:DNA-nicking Smr family endonuclease